MAQRTAKLTRMVLPGHECPFGVRARDMLEQAGYEIDGWYAYYFLDPTTQSTAALLISILGVLAVFTIIAAVAIALDRWFSLRQARSAH